MDSEKILNTSLIYEAVYALVERANTILPEEIYRKLQSFNNTDLEAKEEILQNAYLAKTKKRPLCQDCGQVVIFLSIGEDITFEGENFKELINHAVEDAYADNFYRKSVVRDALYDRENTKTNTPCIIYEETVPGDKFEILLALKGAGAENSTQLKMFNPTVSKEEVYTYIKEVAKAAAKSACPPIMLGIGIGGTADYACYLAKKALYLGEKFEIDEEDIFDAKILTSSTHIASLPVCVNTNCHSSRYSKCTIDPTIGYSYSIIYEDDEYLPTTKLLRFEREEIHSDKIERLKSLNVGDKILLSGTIYTARDMAHKKLTEMINQGTPLPFDLNNSIIFYAGPCPKAKNEVIGPIGPTTSKRMDAFAPLLYKNGVLATIGKGERTIKEGLYFKTTGGVACLTQDYIIKSDLIAFPELGAEAIYKLEVKRFPLEVATV